MILGVLFLLGVMIIYLYLSINKYTEGLINSLIFII